MKKLIVLGLSSIFVLTAMVDSRLLISYVFVMAFFFCGWMVSRPAE